MLAVTYLHRAHRLYWPKAAISTLVAKKYRSSSGKHRHAFDKVPFRRVFDISITGPLNWCLDARPRLSRNIQLIEVGNDGLDGPISQRALSHMYSGVAWLHPVQNRSDDEPFLPHDF